MCLVTGIGGARNHTTDKVEPKVIRQRTLRRDQQRVLPSPARPNHQNQHRIPTLKPLNSNPETQ
jgi:hypothetical protein